MFTNGSFAAVGTAKNGANIAQWGLHGDVNQEWTVVNSTLRSRANTSCYMNSSGSNCVLGGSRMLDFIQNDSTTYGHHVAIRLTGTQLHLTANTDGTGSASGTGTSSKGNVYWAQWKNGLNQRWIFKEDKNLSSGGSTTTGQKLCLPLNKAKINVGYMNDAPQYSRDWSMSHYGVDMARVDTTITKNLRAMGNGKIVATDRFNAMGRVLAVQYDNVLNTSNKNIGSVIVVYGHLASYIKTSGTVTKGEEIAVMGEDGDWANRGNGTNIHVHLDVHINISNPFNMPSCGYISYKGDPYTILHKGSNQTVVSSGLGAGYEIFNRTNAIPFKTIYYCRSLSNESSLN